MSGIATGIMAAAAVASVGMSYHSSRQQEKAAAKAREQAERAAKMQAEQAEQAAQQRKLEFAEQQKQYQEQQRQYQTEQKRLQEQTNAANAKSANALGKQDKGDLGGSSTMLTGAQGIDSSALNLGKKNLLGTNTLLGG